MRTNEYGLAASQLLQNDRPLPPVVKPRHVVSDQLEA